MHLRRLDYYAALEIDANASPEVIERACRFNIDNYAEDSVATYGLMGDDERREALRFFEEARDILCDEARRAEYDASLLRTGVYTEDQLRQPPQQERPAPLRGNEEWTTAEASPPTWEERLPASEAASEAPSFEPVGTDPKPSVDTPSPLSEGSQTLFPAMKAHADTRRVEEGVDTPATSTPSQAQHPSAHLSHHSSDGQSDEQANGPTNGPRDHLSEGPVAPRETAAVAPPSTAPGDHAAPEAAPSAVHDEMAERITTILGEPSLRGDHLRQIRELRGLSVEEVATKTKVSMTNIRFIEAEDFRYLPARVYLRGFLRAYAQALKISADRVEKDYLPRFQQYRGD